MSPEQTVFVILCIAAAIGLAFMALIGEQEN